MTQPFPPLKERQYYKQSSGQSKCRPLYSLSPWQDYTVITYHINGGSFWEKIEVLTPGCSRIEVEVFLSTNKELSSAKLWLSEVWLR